MIDPRIIRQQIANILVLHPELADDEELRADVVEAETSAYDLLRLIVQKIGATKALEAALEQHIKDLEARKDRLGLRIESLRTLAKQILNAADLRKVELPEATLSIGKGRQKLLIHGDVPESFTVYKPEPDKPKIRVALEAGEPLNFACFERGDEVLTVRIAP